MASNHHCTVYIYNDGKVVIFHNKYLHALDGIDKLNAAQDIIHRLTKYINEPEPADGPTKFYDDEPIPIFDEFRATRDGQPANLQTLIDRYVIEHARWVDSSPNATEPALDAARTALVAATSKSNNVSNSNKGIS